MDPKQEPTRSNLERSPQVRTNADRGRDAQGVPASCLAGTPATWYCTTCGTPDDGVPCAGHRRPLTDDEYLATLEAQAREAI